MKIGVISDLHLCINRIYTTENYIKFGFIKQLEDLDILFICGDTSGSFTLVIDFMNWLKNFIISNSYKTKVYFTIGNHEGYEYDAEKIDKTTGCLKLYEQFNDGPVQFLENKSVQIGEYIIFGACLYTDFDLYGKQECSRFTACRKMNDFRYVYDYDENCDIRPIQSNSYIVKFKNTVSNLQNICEENKDKKIIVLTHFCPSEKCIDSQYVGSSLNPAYASHLDNFIINNNNIKLWCCGHSHHPLNTNIEQCKLVMNPYGYFGYEQNLTPNEYKCKVIEI